MKFLVFQPMPNTAHKGLAQTQVVIGNCNSPISRLNRFKTGDVLDYKCVYPILDLRTDIKMADPFAEFDAAMLAAAGRIRDFSEKNNVPVHVMWSGGLDSTCALVALVRAGVRPVVFLHGYSIHENPTMFYQFVKDYEVAHVRDTDRLFSGAVVMGEAGDQLFGSDMMIKMHRRDLFAPNWKDSIINNLKERGRSLLDTFLPIVDECPRQIECAADFFWWWNFSQKSQAVALRYLINAKDPADAATRWSPIFMDKQIQEWSLNAPREAKIDPSVGVPSYKLAIRRFISKYASPDYVLPSKIGSLYRTMIISQHKHPALDENYNKVSALDVDKQLHVNWSFA
jgi:asparagine synthetase B (glutamine-hydrolysing)